MHFQFWHEGLTFIGVFIFLVSFPCVMTAILGTKLIENLGQWPSKSARLQMSVCVQFLLVQIISFAMLALFYHILS